jgi:hypothetical protein
MATAHLMIEMILVGQTAQAQRVTFHPDKLTEDGAALQKYISERTDELVLKMMKFVYDNSELQEPPKPGPNAEKRIEGAEVLDWLASNLFEMTGATCGWLPARTHGFVAHSLQTAAGMLVVRAAPWAAR